MLELKDVKVVFNPGTVNEKVALNHINLLWQQWGWEINFISNDCWGS